MAENGLGFARVVVAVVIEENNFTADFILQPSRGQDFGDEKSFREKPTWLLAETDDRCGTHWFEMVSSRLSFGPSTTCKIRLKIMHAAQPMRLYQR